MIYADLILTNGKVITMDAQESISQAVAVKFGKIIAVGNNSDIGNYVGEETVSIDLLGKTVLPGLIDSHGHFLNEGSSREIYIDLSEEAGIHSISDIQHILTEKAKQTPIGEWIFGYQEDDSKLEEKRHPTILELDVASINHPILITTVGGHFWMANSKAFELAGVIKDSPDPIGGKFDRDPQSGELTGGLHEEAYYLLRPVVGRSEIRAAIDLKNAGELPIRVRMDVTIALLDELDMLGIYRGLGDNWVRICGIKFFFDGAISARTAAVSEPYLDKPDFFGVMATTKEKATELLTKAYQKGFRISAHANGDRAIKIYLDIIEVLQKKYPRLDSRNRDIHCSVINEDLIKKIKELDVLPTIFGAYAYYHGDKLIPSFGIDRLENMFAARSFLDAGILVSAHSDHPCSPFPPLMAIHSLVNRKTKAGKLIGRSQQISVIEALKLYTINAAYHSFDENILGSIEPNKLADFVILEEDILTVPSERIRNIPINMTIIEGKIIYQRQ
ncbi:MAG: amidohydrolase [Promethearchaeota archaeon]|jgi:predicted amidohydrolase YtcJ